MDELKLNELNRDELSMSESKEFLNITQPLEKFAEWFAEAKKIYEKYPKLYKHPEAFVLSTTKKKQPTSRILLMKELREKEGLVFYTNYLSQKGQDITKNPLVALNFFWSPLFRQVCMRGSVKKISRSESEKYWVTRPRDSQISQYISLQSQPVASREQLEKEWNLAKIKFKNKIIPLPKNWGGYLFTPTFIEFWTGREGRFHDRHAFTKEKKSWATTRLYP